MKRLKVFRGMKTPIPATDVPIIEKCTASQGKKQLAGRELCDWKLYLLDIYSCKRDQRYENQKQGIEGDLGFRHVVR